MGDTTYYIDDAASALNSMKINAAQAIQQLEQSGVQVLGTSAKVVTGAVGMGIGVLCDVTLGGESIEQAVVSQTAAQLAGGAAVALAVTVISATGAPIILVVGVSAVAGAVVSYGTDRFVDYVFDLARKNRPYQPPADPYDTRRCHLPIDPTKPNSFTNSKSYRPPPTDPFILDLDGDGVETINVTSGILFDHNADGVKTGTGWVKGDDALLVRDLKEA